eukprot:1076282-Pelagomonas_calceolata.AAC.1
MTLRIILVVVAGTIYNEYTIKPLVNPGLTKRKAKSLAFKLSYHAIQNCQPLLTPLAGMLFNFKMLLGGSLLGARRWRMGEGESGRPGAWRTTLLIPISSASGSHLC